MSFFSKENMHGKRRQYAFVFLYCYCRKTFSEQRWAIKHVILCDKTSRFMRKYWPADSGISELLVIPITEQNQPLPTYPQTTLRIVFMMTINPDNIWVERALLLGHPIWLDINRCDKLLYRYSPKHTETERILNKEPVKKWEMLTLYKMIIQIKQTLKNPLSKVYWPNKFSIVRWFPLTCLIHMLMWRTINWPLIR